MQQNANELGSKPVGRLLFSLAVPTITAQIVNMLYNIVDRIYIGHIPGVGADALTGVGVTFPILMLLSAFSALIGMGGAPRAAIFLGKGDHKTAEQLLGNCAATMLLLGSGLIVFFSVFNRPLLSMFGASAATLPYALEYLNIYVLGSLFMMTSLGLNAFITAQGFARYSMLTVILGAVTNIILDPIFIFVLDWGVQGAALASVLSQAISAIWVLRFLLGKKTTLRLRREYLRITALMLPVLALGISPFIMQSTESLINIALNRSLQRYGGDLAVGSMAILASTMQMLMMPLQGLTQGAQPIISYNFGAKNTLRVKQTFRLLLISCMLFTGVVWGLCEMFPQMFVRLFNSDPALLQTASWAMRIYMGATVLMGAQCACQQTFLAVGEAKTSLFLATLRKIFLLLPLILVLPHFFTDQVFAVFLAEPIADCIAVGTTLLLFAWKFPRILAENERDNRRID